MTRHIFIERTGFYWDTQREEGGERVRLDYYEDAYIDDHVGPLPLMWLLPWKFVLLQLLVLILLLGWVSTDNANNE